VTTRATLGGIFAAVSILVIGWQAGSAALPAVTATGTSTDTSTGSGTTTTSTSTSTSTSTTSAADGTYTGDSASTRFGDVQVAVTISGGQITDVTALQLTDRDRRSVQISNRAAPVLRQEVIASQSANVSNVSGATYTSDGYLRSVQSALDQAGF
jgi:uncharacterized protein with FMN-binding domain